MKSASINHPAGVRIGYLLTAFSMPLLIYAIYFVVRIQGIQPPTDGGLGEFITALNFIFGASICYFAFLLHCKRLPHIAASQCLWWWLASAFLLLLAFDETFMIHEQVSWRLGVSELVIFLFYGGILAILVVSGLRKLPALSFLFLALFVVFSGIAVIADTLFTEGVLIVFGKEIGYEQICESFAALVLSAVFIPVLLAELGLYPEIPDATAQGC